MTKTPDVLPERMIEKEPLGLVILDRGDGDLIDFSPAPAPAPAPKAPPE